MFGTKPPTTPARDTLRYTRTRGGEVATPCNLPLGVARSPPSFKVTAFVETSFGANAIADRSIRIAAIGDLHVRNEIPTHLAASLVALNGQVDLLVIAGDLTDGGKIPEMRLTANFLGSLDMPKVAVLGNHDRRGLRRREMRQLLDAAGTTLLDGDADTMHFPNGLRLGIAGVGGYGGGFWPEEVPDIVSARLSKAVALRARRESVRLELALGSLANRPTDANLVVMHYSPTVSTLGNEPPIKYWMLGNSLLGKVIDDHRVDLVLHGHAHLGNYEGRTPGGVPVRNVAAHVVGRPMLFDIRTDGGIVEVAHGGKPFESAPSVLRASP